MPLIYKPNQSNLPDKDGKKLFYPSLVKAGKVVSTQKLGEIIAEKASLTPGDVHNVVRNLMSAMREQLLNSKSVKLDGLGTFTMIAHANGRGVEKSEDVSSSQIIRLQCRFTPEFKRQPGGSLTRTLIEGVEYVKLSDLTGVKTTGVSTGGDDENPDNNDDDFIDPGA